MRVICSYKLSQTDIKKRKPYIHLLNQMKFMGNFPHKKNIE